MKKLLSVTSMCLALAACGFSPMYGTNGATSQSVSSELAQVSIANISDRSGQYLRNALIDRFYRDGRPADTRYLLSVSSIEEKTTDLDITKDSDATRAQLRLNAKMKLVDQENGKTVLSRNLISTSSYNILTSEFATRVSEQNTRENALNDLARQIELQIGLYLRR